MRAYKILYFMGWREEPPKLAPKSWRDPLKSITP